MTAGYPARQDLVRRVERVRLLELEEGVRRPVEEYAYCYMNIAMKLPRPGASVSEASTPVGVAMIARTGAKEEGACEDTKLLEMPHSRSPRGVR